MSLGSLFRRYRRWNPVHPTAGAFWGIGVGLGCGVGWGPGFGPEAVGFVGAGCGAGFNIGVMFIGAGVGLPSRGVTALPLNALVSTAKGAANTTSTVVVPAMVFAAQQCWQVLSSSVAERGPHAKKVEENPRSKDFASQENKILPDGPLKRNQNGVPPSSVGSQQTGSVTPPRKAAFLARGRVNFRQRPLDLEDANRKR